MFNRREVIGGGSALAALAAIGPVMAGSVAHARVQFHKFAEDPARVASFRRGVAEMQKRDPTDPTSWRFQAAVHWVRDAVITDWSATFPGVSTLVADGFWQQCPHGGPGSANFLLWHRAFLYYFERILRDAAQDPDLALPYWDYGDRSKDGTADSRSLLPVLFAPEGSPVVWPNANPLAFEYREPGINKRTSEITLGAASPDIPLRQPTFFGADETSGFCGADLDTNYRTISQLEYSPHGNVHSALGDRMAPVGKKGMASVPEAAFDPIFWVHHANIDRLWARYVAQPGKSWGPHPDQAWFDATPWKFYDYDKQVYSEPRSYWMDLQDLSYTYDGEGPPQLTWPPAGITTAPLVASKETELFRSGPIRLTATEGAAIAVPAEATQRIVTMAQRAVTAGAGSQEALMLNLDNPHLDGAPAAGFAVLINPTNEELADPNFASAVARLSTFGWDNEMNMEMKPGPISVDITEPVAQRAADTLDIQIKPFALLTHSEGNTTGVALFDAVRIVQVSRGGGITS